MTALNPFHTQGLVHSPHFIFVRGGHRLPDQDFIERLGFVAEERHTRAELLAADSKPPKLAVQRVEHPAFVVAESDEWKMIADDWRYHLWYNRSTQARVEELAREGDVLIFSVGAADNAYDLRAFQDGQLVREWIVDDRLFGTGQRLLVDWGEPLAGEQGLRGGDLITYLVDVARCNGFDLAEVLSTARLWICEPNPHASSVNETQRRTKSWRSA